MGCAGACEGVVPLANRDYFRSEVETMEQSGNIVPAQRFASRPVVVLSAGIFGLLLAVTLVLWAHYGSAVFYEMILAGIAACF
jgi:hypothetical protein